eukprot:scaffold58015_cov45-Phaeocystis_antarctica.AAC.1
MVALRARVGRRRERGRGRGWGRGRGQEGEDWGEGEWCGCAATSLARLFSLAARSWLGGALLDALEGLGRLGRRRGLLQAGLHRGTGSLGRAHGPAFFLVDGDDDLARAVQLLELVQLLARGLRGRGGGLAHGGALGAGWTRGAHHCRVGSCFLVLDDARFTTLSAPLLLPEGDVLPLLSNGDGSARQPARLGLGLGRSTLALGFAERPAHLWAGPWPPSVVRAKVSETSLERCYLRNRPIAFQRTGKHDRRQQ